MTGSFIVGWRQVASAFILLGAIAMITSSYSVVAVPLGEEFGPSRMVLMLGMTVVAGVSAVIAPPLGGLMDTISLRRIMVIGAVMLGTGYAALSYATAFWQVLVIFGLLIAPANVLIGPTAATVLLSRWFVKRRGRAIGIAIAGISIGGVVYPPLIQWLLDSYEWRDGLRVFAVLLLVLTVPAALLVVESPAQRGLNPDGEATVSEIARSEAEASHTSAMTILREPAFWLIAFLFAIVLSGMIGMITNLVPLALDHGIEPSHAALLISIYSIGGFVAKLGFAAVADMFSLRALTLIAFAGFAFGMACLTQSHGGYWVIALGVAAIGLFGGLLVPLKSLLVPRIFGQRVVGRAMGMMSTITLTISIATPPVFGLAFDLTGSYATISLIFALLAVAGMIGVPYIRMHARTPLPAQ